MSDLISRQAAIEAIEEMQIPIMRSIFPEEQFVFKGMSEALSAIKELPSAQPEPLTDKEQRIFLAAMAREEKVCKQVDEECRDCREPYEDSLVRTCHEIIRKVKGALWI